MYYTYVKLYRQHQPDAKVKYWDSPKQVTSVTGTLERSDIVIDAW